MEGKTGLRVKVFMGEFVCSEMVYKQWIVPRRKLVVFVSSTFTDTHEERNVLLNIIFPALRILGREQDIEVRFVDMRYGLKDDSTNRQMTWDECVAELEKCHTESAGISFLSLQADKYGYIPLSRVVRRDIFESHRDKLNDKERETLDEWYSFDSNTQYSTAQGHGTEDYDEI